MPRINVQITLDNIDNNINAQQLADTIEGIIKQVSGIDNVQTNIYDNDGSNSSNPIFAQNTLKNVR